MTYFRRKMDVIKKYGIAYKALGQGEHYFEFEADDIFFRAFENSEIKSGKASIKVMMAKGPNMLCLDFNIKGTVTVDCDRCLEDCELPVDYSGQLTVKFTESELDENERYDGEVLWLNPAEGTLNVAQYIYESIVLSLPYQRVHPGDTNGGNACNPEMLGRFKIVSEEEFDRFTGEERKMEENPEWEKLRQLKGKL